MRKHIAAHTTMDLGGYVDFVSINAEEDGRVSIALRVGGTYATLCLGKEDWEKLAAQISTTHN